MRINHFLLIFFIALIFLSARNSAYAYENDIGVSIIHPGHPLYFLKALKEGLEMHFAQTSNVQSIRQLEFATRRVREVKGLTLVKREDLIQQTLERYWVHIQISLSKGEKAFSKEIYASLTVHIQTLEKVYSSLSDLKAKMAIRSTLNKIIKRVEIPKFAKYLVCNLFEREATSTALTDTEQIILKKRARDCSYLYMPN